MSYYQQAPQYYGQSIGDGVMGFFGVIFGFFYLLIIGAWVVSYVVRAIGMHTMAKRRGIHHSWMAWVPVGEAWLLGGVSDQYQYLVKGKTTGRRKVLLGLSIALASVWFAMMVLLTLVGNSSMWNLGTLGALAALLVICYFAFAVLAIVLAVFRYLALYDLYMSCDPDNCLLYFLLSLFLSITMPFLIFCNRKKDKGMPERTPVYEENGFEPSEPQTESVPEEPSYM